MEDLKRECFTVTLKESEKMLWGKEWKVIKETVDDRDKDMEWTSFIFERLSDGKFFHGEALMFTQGGFEFDGQNKTQEINEVFKTWT